MEEKPDREKKTVLEQKNHDSKHVNINKILLDETTSSISWMHEKKSFAVEVVLNLSSKYLYYDLLSPELGALCESFGNL